MIVHKFCNIKEVPEGVIAQIMLDGNAHYTIFDYHRDRDDIIKDFMDYLEKCKAYPDYYVGCAEAGYEDRPVIAANWNNVKSNNIENWLDKYGISLEWSDEWTGCTECGKAVRSSPNSYCWEPSYVQLSCGDIICRECWKDNIKYIIEDHQSDYHHGFSRKALPSDFCEILENQGFTCWQERKPWEDEESCARYETGWHPGQNDDPKKVFKTIMEDSKDWIVVFVITSRGQFDINWTAYVKRNDEA